MPATPPIELPAAIARYRTAVDAALKQAIADDEQALYAMVRYHFGWREADGAPGPGRRGKGLRPALCLLVSDALTGTHERALPAAAALELVHNFSLVHDDIQDGDRERHHRPTVWSVFGKPAAINAGTAMYTLASLALAGLETVGVEAERRLTALRLLHRACLRLLEGQTLDLAFERRTDISVPDYLEMVQGKTAALIACAARLGALLAPAAVDAEALAVAERFGAWGEELGLAFQIRDDVLGIWGDAARTGKPVGADIAARKKSLPVVDAFERAQGPQRAALAELYASEMTPEGTGVVLGILDELGTQQRAMALAFRHRDRALTALADLPVGAAARADLEAVTVFLTERDR